MVDDPERAGDEAQPRHALLQVAVRRVLDRDPHPQPVLDREHHERDEPGRQEGIGAQIVA